MDLIRAMRAPLVVWLILEVIAAATLVWSASQLPPRVASHFGFQGQADAAMSRTADLVAMGATILLVPLLMIGIGLLIGIMPPDAMNIPHREYWLAPERRRETTGFVARQTVWFACGMTVFFTVLNWLIVEANLQKPPQLSNGIWYLLGVFLAFVVAWLIVLVRHFSRPPRGQGYSQSA